MGDDWLPFFQAVGQGVAAPPADRDGEIGIIGERWPHDGNRESVLTIGLQQARFARDLVAGVRPVRVIQRRRFGDPIAGGRLLVRRGGANEDVLLGPTAEECEIALDIIGCIRDPIHHYVELAILEDGMDGCWLMDVGRQMVDAGDCVMARATMQQK